MDLLFKWFLDLNIADPAFDHSTFSKNRERLLTHRVADQFFAGVVEEARQRDLLSENHFTVDGTLQGFAEFEGLCPIRVGRRSVCSPASRTATTRLPRTFQFLDPCGQRLERHVLLVNERQQLRSAGHRGAWGKYAALTPGPLAGQLNWFRQKNRPFTPE